MKKVSFAVVVLTSVLLCSGCAHFEYRLVQPAASAQRISKEGISVPYDPLTYQIAHREDRVVMRISNRTETPVRLLSEKSYLVDPCGETHPVRGRLIAPRAFVDVSFPPMPRYYGDPAYPEAGFYWSPYWMPYWYTTSFYSWPEYQISSPYDWEWRTGEVRLRLAYEQASRTFDHDFVITREEMKK